ncbi:hypothetical protein WA026_005262, partial [Henosepilachna vigintioctopunctata]
MLHHKIPGRQEICEMERDGEYFDCILLFLKGEEELEAVVCTERIRDILPDR